MTSTDLPRGVGERIRGVGLLFGSGTRGGGRSADEGGSPRALLSPWISRLRPPPRRAPLFPLAAEWDPNPAPAPSVRYRGAAPTHGPPTRARSPATVTTFSSRFLCRDTPLAAASSPRHVLLQDAPLAAASSSLRVLLQQRIRLQQREDEAERWNVRLVARVEKEGHGEAHRNGISAGFGPFQVGTKRARLLLANGPKLQQEHTEWNLAEVENVGCFPFRQRMTRLRAVREVVKGPAESEGGEEGFLREDVSGRVLGRPETGQLEAVGVARRGCRLWKTSFFPHGGTLCPSPSNGIANNMGSGDAAGSSRYVKTNQWLHRHRWGENSRLLDCHPASSSWPVGKGNTMCRRVSGLCAGPQGLIDEASERTLPDQKTQGAAFEEYTDDMATTRTFYAPHSNEAVQQQLVTKSSFWNIERVERTHVLSSLHPKLALGKTVCRKRSLDPDAPALSQSQRLRTRD